MKVKKLRKLARNRRAIKKYWAEQYRTALDNANYHFEVSRDLELEGNSYGADCAYDEAIKFEKQAYEAYRRYLCA